ncbi:hypothetical protein FDY98_09825 [Halomonas sp. PA16-9]|nr:hypothetical protein FDY98_09825 [Halomonas sp. PA16-9]
MTAGSHGRNRSAFTGTLIGAAGYRLESKDNQKALPDNRLTQLNGTRYRYDGAGNLVERQQPNGERLTLGYDAPTA